MAYKNDPDIDNTDRRILAILMQDANIPYARIADQIGVSGGTIHVRMKKLEQMGIVEGATLKVVPSKLGYDVTAFLGIYLDKSSMYDKVAEKLKSIPEIIDAHYTTGLYNVFAKVVCRDTNHLRHVLYDKIQKINGIQRTETFISLEQSISRPLTVELDEAED